MSAPCDELRRAVERWAVAYVERSRIGRLTAPQSVEEFGSLQAAAGALAAAVAVQVEAESAMLEMVAS